MLDILRAMGARAEVEGTSITVHPSALHGVDVDMGHCPDLVPTVAVLAAFAQGPTRVRNVAHLRIKESDRLVTTTRELTALGAQVRIAGDDLIIKGVDALTGGEVDSHNDHRIAMMAAIAASRATGEVVIHGAEAVNKSYPDFFDHYRLLGGKITLEEE